MTKQDQPSAKGNVKGTKPSASAADANNKPQSGWRETIESLSVAFILALLFRGFVAEAFVIPTGSMAPVLMGAHKDLFCSECGARYQVGASSENADRRQGSVFTSTCSNCGHENVVNFSSSEGNTFSGDRIFVSKFAYLIREPERWDVIVFKYPHNAKVNYIKRLIGLPGETIHVRHGDLYRTTAEIKQPQILRKSDKKLMAMRHLVYDTLHQSKTLNEVGYPSRWQPWQAGGVSSEAGGWSLELKDNHWQAQVAAAAAKGTAWLRYFHNLPTQNEWNQAQQGVSLKSVSPYRGTAITDYYAYNSYWHTATAIDGADGLINYYPQGLTLQQAASLNLYRSGGTSAAGVGQHWTADLMVEADVDLGSEEGSFLLELVDSGRHFQVEFNTKSGEASLWVQTGDKREPLQSGGQAAKAPSPLRGGGNYQVRFSNVDQELRVWVNDKRLNFGEVEYPVVPLEERFPHYSTNDPQDAGPVAVGSQGVSVSVDRLVIYRDKYYTSITSDFSSLPLDYRPGTRLDEVHELFRMPEQWEASPIWGSRRVDLAFELKEDQFLPMGDNSPESMDARCWPAEPFVHRDLLIGKALFIYWPHPWHGFLPHLSRMGMIR